MAERAQSELAASLNDSLGVSVLRVAVHDLHPPGEVVASFHAVAEAIQRRDEAVLRAESAALALAADADIAAERRTRDAEAASAASRATSESEAAVFRARRAGLAAPPGVPGAEWRAFADSLLKLDAWVAGLAGRPKMVIDAAEVPGRRQVILYDPAAGPAPLVPSAPTPSEVKPP